jgi:hypothetical protein
MTLRTRILLGYGYLIGLLLLSVSVAAINSQRVAGTAKQILDRNIQSLGQAIEMLEQLERQDSETLLGLLQPATGTGLEDAEHAFEVALAAADETSKTSVDDEDREVLTLACARTSTTTARPAPTCSRGSMTTRVSAAEDYAGRGPEGLPAAQDRGQRATWRRRPRR